MWTAERQRQHREAWRAQGLCTRCGREPAGRFTLGFRCRQQQSAYQATIRFTTKLLRYQQAWAQRRIVPHVVSVEQ